VDRYDSQNDHYLIPGSSTLKNLLNITDLDALEHAEREITAASSRLIQFGEPPYDMAYLQQLHHDLFCNLYAWAGQIRNVDISKGGTRFCTADRIVPEASKLFTQLQQHDWLRGLSPELMAERMAYFYSEFNMIHPFREGNGRVQRLLFEHLALSAGYKLQWGHIGDEQWTSANVESVTSQPRQLEKLFRKGLTQL
tara:strand:- start:83 stop:670 length:588 start_codon:yes stop_codon:yes gene_type:complete